MIIKFETYTVMCSKKLWPKHFQNSTKGQKFESKQHLEALAFVDASYKVDSHKNWS